MQNSWTVVADARRNRLYVTIYGRGFDTLNHMDDFDRELNGAPKRLSPNYSLVIDLRDAVAFPNGIQSRFDLAMARLDPTGDRPGARVVRTELARLQFPQLGGAVNRRRKYVVDSLSDADRILNAVATRQRVARAA